MQRERFSRDDVPCQILPEKWTGFCLPGGRQDNAGFQVEAGGPRGCGLIQGIPAGAGATRAWLWTERTATAICGATGAGTTPKLPACAKQNGHVTFLSLLSPGAAGEEDCASDCAAIAMQCSVIATARPDDSATTAVTVGAQALSITANNATLAAHARSRLPGK